MKNTTISYKFWTLIMGTRAFKTISLVAFSMVVVAVVAPFRVRLLAFKTK